MLILKVVARLLDYPTQALIDNSQHLIEATRSSREIPPELRQQTIQLIEAWAEADLYDLQAQYDGLFERGRYLSLLIFEHVHGESRDRGQAMVDLLNMYREKGLELNAREMPDYLPLFLEFLSEQDDLYAREWLADVSHILALLEERITLRAANRRCLFSNLLVVSGAKINRKEIKDRLSKEQPDTNMRAIDKAWEDKEIRFDDPIKKGACSSNSSAAHHGPHSHTPSPQSPSPRAVTEAEPLVWRDEA